MATGFQAMQQAVKNISSSRGGGGRRFSYFNLDDGQSIIVRFLTDVDEIVTCDFYEYVKTNQSDTSTNSFIVAPDYYAEDPSWSGTDWVLKYGGKTKPWGSDELEDPKPKERTVAIAVEREAIAVDNNGSGRPKFKYQDKIIEVEDKDGKKHKGRNFIVIRKDAKTFWGGVVGYYGEFGTLVDRDYKITRNGAKLATTFATIPVGPAEDWEDIEVFRRELHTRYGYNTDGKDPDGKDVGNDDPERFMYPVSTLAQWCEEQASEDMAKRLLGAPREDAQARHAAPPLNSPGPAPAWAGGDDEAQAAPAPAAGDVSALRARLEAHT